MLSDLPILSQFEKHSVYLGRIRSSVTTETFGCYYSLWYLLLLLHIHKVTEIIYKATCICLVGQNEIFYV